MLHRGVGLVVLVGFVASQLATVEHAHAWTSLEDQQKHDAKPHVHWQPCGHSHGDHSHASCDDQSPANPLQDSEGSVPTPEPGEPAHDDSAIFIAACLGLPMPGSSSTFLPSANELAAVPAAVVREIESHLWLPMCWHPPDVDWQDSHLYLSLRNLRI